MSSIDEVRDNFRVRVAAKDNSRTTELALQFDMVLDNAVVNNRHIAGQVGMSILLARAAMSGPSSVSDTYGAVERPTFKRVLQLIQLPAARTISIAPSTCTATPAES